MVCRHSEVLGSLPGEFYGFYKKFGSTIIRVEPCWRGYQCFGYSSSSREVELLGVERNVTCRNGVFDNVVYKTGPDEPVMFALAKFYGLARRIGNNRFALKLK